MSKTPTEAGAQRKKIAESANKLLAVRQSARGFRPRSSTSYLDPAIAGLRRRNTGGDRPPKQARTETLSRKASRPTVPQLSSVDAPISIHPIPVFAASSSGVAGFEEEIRKVLRGWFDERCLNAMEKQLWPFIFHVRLASRAGDPGEISMKPSFSLDEGRKSFYLEQCRMGGMKFIIFYATSSCNRAVYIYGLMNTHKKTLMRNSQDITMLDLYRKDLFRDTPQQFWPERRRLVHPWDEDVSRYPVLKLSIRDAIIPIDPFLSRPAAHYINAMYHLSKFYDKTFVKKNTLFLNAYMRDIERTFCFKSPDEFREASLMFLGVDERGNHSEYQHKLLAGARLVTHRICARDPILKDIVLKGTAVWIYFCFDYHSCFEGDIIKWLDLPNISKMLVLDIQEPISKMLVLNIEEPISKTQDLVIQEPISVRQWIFDDFAKRHADRPSPTKVIKTYWTNARELVADRLVYIHRGYVYITYADVMVWLTGFYRKEIERFAEKDEQLFWSPLQSLGKAHENYKNLGKMRSRRDMWHNASFTVHINPVFLRLSRKDKMSAIREEYASLLEDEKRKMKLDRRAHWHPALYDTNARLKYRYFPQDLSVDPVLVVSLRDWIPIRKEIVKEQILSAAKAMAINDKRYADSVVAKQFSSALEQGVPVFEAFMATFASILPPCMKHPLELAYNNKKHLQDKQRWLFFQFMAHRRIPLSTAEFLWKDMCTRDPNAVWGSLKFYPKHFYNSWKNYESDATQYKGGFVSCKTVVSTYIGCCPFAGSSKDIEDISSACGQHLNIAAVSSSYRASWHSPGHVSTQLEIAQKNTAASSSSSSAKVAIVYCEDDDPQ